GGGLHGAVHRAGIQVGDAEARAFFPRRAAGQRRVQRLALVRPREKGGEMLCLLLADFGKLWVERSPTFVAERVVGRLPMPNDVKFHSWRFIPSVVVIKIDRGANSLYTSACTSDQYRFPRRVKSPPYRPLTFNSRLKMA